LVQVAREQVAKMLDDDGSRDAARVALRAIPPVEVENAKKTLNGAGKQADDHAGGER
jgi:hypothetical protein